MRPAVENAGLEWPLRRVTVNLSPADLRKDGPRFDLPIAAAVLAATAQLPKERLAGFAFAGELSLKGTLLPTPGILAMAAAASAAGLEWVVVPEANAAEPGLVEGLRVVGAPSLDLVVGFAAARGSPARSRRRSSDRRPHRRPTTSRRSGARPRRAARSRSPPSAGTTC